MSLMGDAKDIEDPSEPATDANPKCMACGDYGYQDISTGGSHFVPCSCDAGKELEAYELKRKNEAKQ